MLPSSIHNFYVKSESRVCKGCKGVTRNFIADYFFSKNGYQGVFEDIRYQNRFSKKNYLRGENRVFWGYKGRKYEFL